MTRQWRPSLNRAVPGLLGALVVTNLAFLIPRRTAGPAVGAAFYLALLVLIGGQRQRHYWKVIVGGLVGHGLHASEFVALGWPAQPMLLVLNLILPVPLVVVAWMAGRLEEQAGGSGRSTG